MDDVRNIWSGKAVKSLYKGVDKQTVQFLTSSMGGIQKNYRYDPLIRIMVLACTMLACSQFFVGGNDYIFRILNVFLGFVM